METVTVIDAKHPNGEYIINKSDFDASKHTLKGVDKTTKKPKEAKTEGE